MRARAEAGFLAARPDRRPVYQRLRDVVVAALGLHEFLVANEDNIEYDPAAGGASRDPVLEAVPATPELGTEMWDRVDSITTAWTPSAPWTWSRRTACWRSSGPRLRKSRFAEPTVTKAFSRRRV
jgi:hypothetical protein